MEKKIAENIYNRFKYCIDELIITKENLLNENFFDEEGLQVFNRCLDKMYIIEARLHKIAKRKKEDI